VGLSATQVLFDNGRLKANVEFASAGHAAAIALSARGAGRDAEAEDGTRG
jgi:hypothetical protein